MSNDLNDVVSGILDHSSNPDVEAGELLNHLQSRFGWAGFVLSRSDVNDHLGRPLTDDEWSKVTRTNAWQAMVPIFLEGSTEYVEHALAEAGVPADVRTSG